MYAYTTLYSVESIFLFTCVLIVLKIIIVVCLGQYFYTKYVRNHRMEMGRSGLQADDEGEQVDERGKSMKREELEFMI